MTRGKFLNLKFSTVVRHGGDLGPRPSRFSPSGFFFYGGCVLADRSPPSSRVASISASVVVAAVLITPKGAESSGRGRIGVIGAFFFLPSEAV